MNPNRTYEENMAALKKVLTQRTYTALSHRNIEFVLKYQNRRQLFLSCRGYAAAPPAAAANMQPTPAMTHFDISEQTRCSCETAPCRCVGSKFF